MIDTDYFESVEFAERALVGALLIGTNGHQRAIDHIGDVETIDIHCGQLRPIVAAALDIRDEGGAPNIGSILERLEHNGQLALVTMHAGAGLFESLMQFTPDIWHIDTWVRVILDASRKRDAAAKLEQLKQSVDKNPEHAIRTAERLIETLKGAKRIKPADSLLLTRMSDVQEVPINPLWKNRWFRGKFNLLVGDPGRGKTLVAMYGAATASIGASWADGSESTGVGSVIIFSSEDDPGDTLLPRLKRAGADLSKIHFMETAMVFNPKTGKMEREAFDLGKHVPLLIEAIKRIGDVVLLIIDPISAYGGKVDSHRNAEVRAMLTDLISMAAEYGVCILGITHMNKGVGGKSIYRATGSLAYAAAARSVWMVCEDREDDRRRLMLPIKCNIAKRLDGMAFRIESDFEGPPYIHWESDTVPLTADGYLAQEENGDRKNEAESALAKAVTFLQEQLKDGPVLSKELEAAVKANYIAPATYKRARESLHCRAEKTGKIWWTLLPGQKLPEKEESQPASNTTLDALDTVATLDPLN